MSYRPHPYLVVLLLMALVVLVFGPPLVRYFFFSI